MTATRVEVRNAAVAWNKKPVKMHCNRHHMDATAAHFIQMHEVQQQRSAAWRHTLWSNTWPDREESRR
eukprot:352171-Chlamydomonas_euryale.AAC.3